MSHEPSPVVQELLDRGRRLDAILAATGHPQPPGPWAPPTPEQVDAARRMQGERRDFTRGV